jgi:hypothetical protein
MWGFSPYFDNRTARKVCQYVKELEAETLRNSNRAWKLARFIAEKTSCADCPAWDICTKDGSMCLSDCIYKIFEWADGENATIGGHKNER